MNEINRREALKRTALFMGGVLSAGTTTAFLKACSSKSQTEDAEGAFSEKKSELINHLCDTILPRTDTPGALDVGVPQFVEFMVNECLREQEKENFLSGLDRFSKEIKSQFGSDFIELEPNQQLDIVKRMNEKIAGEKMKVYEEPSSFFWTLKELILLGYFTSEVGASEVLQYKAIPTRYDGCVSLDEVGGKAWATS